jgi:hypothetical protein
MRRFFDLDCTCRNLRPIRIKILAATIAVLTIYIVPNANVGTSGVARRTLLQLKVRCSSYSKLDPAVFY